jgi:hypothetical protein
MMTTNKVSNGYFEVLWGNEPTEYTIINGSLGQGGNEPNMYGIKNDLTGKMNWQGSIQKCKSMLKHTLKMRNK